MTRKRFIVGLISVIFGFTLIFIWNNILILDDSHPSFDEVSQNDSMPLPEQNNIQGDSPNPPPIQQPQNISPANEHNPRPKGHHIHINLDEYKMYVYKDGQLIKVYPVSGGKSSTPTPLGTWRIISKDTWGEGFGGAWMGFNVPYGKYGIHGTVYPWLIGKSNASKGCIRMKNTDVRELYKIVPHGTTVNIIHNNKIFRTMKSGDIGSDIIELQKNLKKLGYYRGGADGRFGTGLKQCVQKFQKDNKIWSSGKVDKRTYNLIHEKVKASENSSQ